MEFFVSRRIMRGVTFNRGFVNLSSKQSWVKCISHILAENIFLLFHCSQITIYKLIKEILYPLCIVSYTNIKNYLCQVLYLRAFVYKLRAIFAANQRLVENKRI